MERTFKIFIDFDGTITIKDVGEAMFLEFGNSTKANQIIDDWINHKINAKETWQLLCNTIENLDRKKFDEFIDSISIDDGFKDFVTYCLQNNYEMRVLSDGLDYYINRILIKENLDHLELFSNKLEFNSDDKLIPIFPFTDSECERCANCKRNHIINYSGDEEYSIYIGDGWSDTCPAQFCDFIFAKNSLLKYCETNRITFFPFANFYDVIAKLEQLKEKKRLKKRYQAELKRREVYASG